MFPFIESIRLEHGKFARLDYHERRMRKAILHHFQEDLPTSLETILSGFAAPRTGLHKCRVEYDHTSHRVVFTPYTPRPVNSLKVVYEDAISYPYKFADRLALDRLYARRGECDDVLIIRNGMVTDSSYANVVFRHGRDWFTPSSCLLEGTMRQYLLDQKAIKKIEIRAHDLPLYDAFKIINAMIEFESPELPIKNMIH